MGATGYAHANLPDGPERDEVITLLRLGQRFAEQWHGHRGFLQCRIDEIVKTLPEPTFHDLLERLNFEAERRDLAGASAFEKVDRINGLLVYYHPSQGRKEITFPALRNVLTKAKKFCAVTIHHPR
ncbi:MAG: hypothetical protein AB1450_11535 [Pseudomonadota bacterium]